MDLLKIDVEGHELEVIKGNAEFLNLCKKVVLETHEKEGGPCKDKIMKVLRRHGFKLSIVSNPCFQGYDILYGHK